MTWTQKTWTQSTGTQRTWTKDIVVRLEAAAEDADVLSAARLETLLREAVTTIRALRHWDDDLDFDEGAKGLTAIA